MINQRLFGTPIKGLVRQKLESRQRDSGEVQFGQNVTIPKDIEQSSVTPFVRMWTSVKLIDEGIIGANETVLNNADLEQEGIDLTNKNSIKQFEDKLRGINFRDKFGVTYNKLSIKERINKESGLKEFVVYDSAARKAVDVPRQTYMFGNHTYYDSYETIEANQSIDTTQNQNQQNQPSQDLSQLPAGSAERRAEYDRRGWAYDNTIDTSVEASSNNTAVDIRNRVFPNELHDNKLFKPAAGVTSMTSETEGSMGLIKRTTVNFLVHNFHDFDKIYNKFFLKPGATIFIDFGWSSIPSLYEPEELIEQDDMYEYLYGQPSVYPGQKLGKITEANGDLEVLQGLVVDYSAKVLPNGSVECSVTITSSNAALLSQSTEQTMEARVKSILTQGIMFLGIGSLIYDPTYDLNLDLNLTQEPDEDFHRRKRADIEAFMATPDPNTNVGDFNTYARNLEVYAQKFLGQGWNPNRNAIRTGVFINSLDAEDVYISWGRFEDLIVNTQFGFGESIDNINLGKKFEVKINSANSMTKYSQEHFDAQGSMAQTNEHKPVTLFPTWWCWSDPIFGDTGIGVTSEGIVDITNDLPSVAVKKEALKYTDAVLTYQDDDSGDTIRTANRDKVDKGLKGSYNFQVDKYPKEYYDDRYVNQLSRDNNFDLTAEEFAELEIIRDPNNTGSTRTALLKRADGTFFAQVAYASEEDLNEAFAQAAMDTLKIPDLVKQDKEQQIIPLREVFINVDVIIEEFSKAENDTIKKVLNAIIKRCNEDSGGLFDWQLLQGEVDSEVKVIDRNFVEAEISKYTKSDDGTSFDSKKLFKFNIMSPKSMIKEYNFELKTPSGNLGNMYAIQGMSHDNKLFTIDPNVQKDLKTIYSLDPDQLSIVYEPDGGGFRAQQSLDKLGDPIFNVFEFLKPLVMESNILTSRGSNSGLFNANYGTGIIPGSTKEHMSKEFDSETAKQLDSQTNKDYNESRLQEWERLTDLNNQSMIAKGHGLAMNLKEYRDGTTSYNMINENMSMLLPYYCNLTIHGISSIIPGDTFQVDYLPMDYKNRSYLQTMKVIHNIDATTWSTTLENQFRTKPDDNVEIKKVTGTAGMRMSSTYFESLKLPEPVFCGNQKYRVSIQGDQSISKLFYSEFSAINKAAAEYLFNGDGDDRFEGDKYEIYLLHGQSSEAIYSAFDDFSGKYDSNLTEQIESAYLRATEINEIERGDVTGRRYFNQSIQLERIFAVMSDIQVIHYPGGKEFLTKYSSWTKVTPRKGIGFKFKTPNDISACTNTGAGNNATLDIHIQPLFAEYREKNIDGDTIQSTEYNSWFLKKRNGDTSPFKLSYFSDIPGYSGDESFVDEVVKEYNKAFPSSEGFIPANRLNEYNQEYRADAGSNIYHSPVNPEDFGDFSLSREDLESKKTFTSPWIMGTRATKDAKDYRDSGEEFYQVEFIGRIYPPSVSIKPNREYFMLVIDGQFAIFDIQRLGMDKVTKLLQFFTNPNIDNKIKTASGSDALHGIESKEVEADGRNRVYIDIDEDD